MKLRCVNIVGAGREIQALLPKGFRCDNTSYGIADKQWITVWHERWTQFPTEDWENLQDEVMQAVQLVLDNHGESSMKMVLTDFARKAHFDPTKPGTIITNRTHSVFEREANIACQPEHATNGEVQMMDGYAPFCKLICIKNWTNARTGTLPITGDNTRFLRSGYKARSGSEVPVLSRWFDPSLDLHFSVPLAKYLMLVLYSKEQLEKEGTKIDADWGIVAILGQLTNEEEPMPPITVMRNALGVDEGGSGVPLDREAYMRSVNFWKTHAIVGVVKS